MSDFRFILNQSVPFEETLSYEFKEVKGRNPIDSIKNKVDEYVVAFLNREIQGHIYWGIENSGRTVVGVHLEYKQRDELRRKVTEKLFEIKPAITPSDYQVVLSQIIVDG